MSFLPFLAHTAKYVGVLELNNFQYNLLKYVHDSRRLSVWYSRDKIDCDGVLETLKGYLPILYKSIKGKKKTIHHILNIR